MAGREVFGAESTTRHLHECSSCWHVILNKDHYYCVFLGADVNADDELRSQQEDRVLQGGLLQVDFLHVFLVFHIHDCPFANTLFQKFFQAFGAKNQNWFVVVLFFQELDYIRVPLSKVLEAVCFNWTWLPEASHRTC